MNYERPKAVVGNCISCGKGVEATLIGAEMRWKTLPTTDSYFDENGKLKLDSYIDENGELNINLDSSSEIISVIHGCMKYEIPKEFIVPQFISGNIYLFLNPIFFSEHINEHPECESFLSGSVITEDDISEQAEYKLQDGRYFCKECAKAKGIAPFQAEKYSDLIEAYEKNKLLDFNHFKPEIRINREFKDDKFSKGIPFIELDKSRQLINFPYVKKGFLIDDIFDNIYKFSDINDFAIYLDDKKIIDYDDIRQAHSDIINSIELNKKEIGRESASFGAENLISWEELATTGGIVGTIAEEIADIGIPLSMRSLATGGFTYMTGLAFPPALVGGYLVYKIFKTKPKIKELKVILNPDSTNTDRKEILLVKKLKIDDTKFQQFIDTTMPQIISALTYATYN